MQNKLYTIQFSHLLMTNSQSAPKQRSWNPELADFANFSKLSKKTKLPQKFKLLDKRGYKLTDKKRAEIPNPWPTSIHKLSTASMVWNVSIGQLGRSACAPSQLLHACS